MFTGIVQAVGRIVRTRPFEVDAGQLDLAGVAVGDSICVQGVCLTVTAIRGRGFTADVSEETLRVTTGLERPGAVNLEKSLAVGDKLGGHLVTGHVDAIGTIRARAQEADALQLMIEAPREVLRYCVPKGSITVDGISLTLNEVTDRGFRVTIIPHTAKVTTLGIKQVGDAVNLEADLVGKYVERLFPDRESGGEPDIKIDRDYLQKRGLI